MDATSSANEPRARIGMIFNEDVSYWLQILAEYQGVTPHKLVIDAIEILKQGYLDISNE